MSKKDDTVNIDINKITYKFGMPNDPDKDEKLVDLLAKSCDKKIPVYVAVIPMEKIKPFCSYKPKKEDLDKIRERYLQYVLDKEPQFLHVYSQEDSFIMSDDYYAYYVYLEAGFKDAPCIILGDTDNPIVADKKRVNYDLFSISPYTE